MTKPRDGYKVTDSLNNITNRRVHGRQRSPCGILAELIRDCFRLPLAIAVIWATFACGPLSFAQTVSPDSATRAVHIHEIHVKGSRFPEKSVLHLTGLQVGQTVDDSKVRAALGYANASGLFKNISYTYESLPDSIEVILDLQVNDEAPLVPATIKVPGVDEDKVWQYLERFDPFFTHVLPPTEKAISLYARYMTKYLESIGRNDVAMVGKAEGADHVTGVVFVPAKLH